MKWASSISKSPDLKIAQKNVCQEILKQLDNKKPDLVFVFVSPQHREHWNHLLNWIQQDLAPAHLIGCSGGGVIGQGEEIERQAALSLTAAILPDVNIHSFHFANDALPTLKSDRKIWEQLMGVSFSSSPHFVLLADSFSFDLPILLKGLDFAFPWSKKIGGIASAAQGPGENILFCNQKFYHSGLVGVALSGNIVVDHLVAQGFRPIGETMTISECQGNQIQSLGGRAPFEVLREVYDHLSPEDQNLFKTSLFVGLAMKDELPQDPKVDFLIRNIIGINPEGGALAIGAAPHKGQSLQFYIRDAETSSRDLELLLEDYYENLGRVRNEGALLFSCLGRGFYLYGVPNHDSDLFKKYLGSIPLGGFFCNGEIGSIHGKTHLHGYTSSFGIFRSRYA